MKGRASKLFIGFPWLEDLLKIHRKEEPLYVTTQTVPPEGGSSNVPSVYAFVLMVQSVAGPQVRYCRISLGYTTYLYSKPFDSEHDAKVEAAQEAERIVRGELERQGLTVVTAYVNEPKNIHRINGHARFLDYDTKAKTFVYRTPEDQARVPVEGEKAA